MFSFISFFLFFLLIYLQVVEAAAEVKSLADKAQADIGLDYAWLDDVTYDDWQKYHDLMRSTFPFPFLPHPN